MIPGEGPGKGPRDGPKLENVRILVVHIAARQQVIVRLVLAQSANPKKDAAAFLRPTSPARTSCFSEL